MDTKKNSKWINALELLFKECESLTEPTPRFDQDKIEHNVFYCLHVKLAIQDGVEPCSFDEWSSKADVFDVNTNAEVYVEDKQFAEDDIKTVTNQINDSFNTDIEK